MAKNLPGVGDNFSSGRGSRSAAKAAAQRAAGNFITPKPARQRPHPATAPKVADRGGPRVETQKFGVQKIGRAGIPTLASRRTSGKGRGGGARGGMSGS